MNPNDKEVLTKMLENERNREYFRWYVSTRNAAKPTKKRKRGKHNERNQGTAGRFGAGTDSTQGTVWWAE